MGENSEFRPVPVPVLHEGFKQVFALDGLGNEHTTESLAWSEDNAGWLYFSDTYRQIRWRCKEIRVTADIDTWPMVTFWSVLDSTGALISLKIEKRAPCVVYAGIRGTFV